MDWVTMWFSNRFIFKIQISETNLGKLINKSQEQVFGVINTIHYMNPDFQQFLFSCQRKFVVILLQKQLLCSSNFSLIKEIFDSLISTKHFHYLTWWDKSGDCHKFDVFPCGSKVKRLEYPFIFLCLLFFFDSQC